MWTKSKSYAEGCNNNFLTMNHTPTQINASDNSQAKVSEGIIDIGTLKAQNKIKSMRMIHCLFPLELTPFSF